MKANRRKRGFTLMETLIAVALLCVVSATAMVGVSRYRRSLHQLEMDSIAKELFVAAQNHLTAAENQGYLGRSDFGSEEGGGIHYFIVGGADNPDDRGSVLNLMLPFGAIDETVRSGSYVIRYQPGTARMLDVFYAEREGSDFSHTFSHNEYESLISAYRGDDRKEARGRYGSGQAVIGYFGGVGVDDLEQGAALLPPSIRVVNAERLYVTVTDPNAGVADAQLKLIITGETSKVHREVNVKSALYATAAEYTVVLDDITVENGHFYELFCSDDPAKKLIPGEDISVRAVAYSNSKLTNEACSVSVVVNSLFAKRDGSEVSVGNIRHLENLSRKISGMDGLVTSAVQTGDLSWTEFCERMGDDHTRIYAVDGTVSNGGMFLPVDPVSGFRYDGGGYTISDIVVAGVQNGGLFGSLNGGTVENLELVGFSVSSAHAGALAGEVNATAVSGVLARNDRNSGDAALEISGSDSAGGLIGVMTGGSVEQCTAALYVRSASGAAGGLIGSVSGGTVTCSYSGGHTTGGQYLIYDFEGQTGRPNVRGGEAGGLVGKAENAAVSFCYSTCSVRSSVTAGGLLGTVSGGTVSDCYAIGFVGGDALAGALVGSANGTNLTSGNRYLEIANTEMAPVGNTAVAEISAIDSDKETYSDFIRVDDAAVAYTYDRQVAVVYGGYYFPTVAQMAGLSDAAPFIMSHYGDWAVPETLVVNDTASGGGIVRSLAAHKEPGPHNVHYHPNGGSWRDTEGINHYRDDYWMLVDPGRPAIRPDIPRAPSGMIFLGWTTDPDIAGMHDFSGYRLGGDVNDLTVVREQYLWDFDDPVQGNMELYAVWSETVTVTFSPNGSAFKGNELQRWLNDNDLKYYSVEGKSLRAVIPKGDTVRCPIDPTPYTKNRGYDFCFWLDDHHYKNTVFDSMEDVPDKVRKHIFDFSKPVLENTNLYPCWLPGGTLPRPDPDGPDPDQPDPAEEVKVILKKINTVYEVLEGAKFTLSTADGTVIAENLVSNKKGIIYVGVLPAGTYYLTETTAPVGYQCPDTPYVLEVFEGDVLIE